MKLHRHFPLLVTQRLGATRPSQGWVATLSMRAIKCLDAAYPLHNACPPSLGSVVEDI